MRHKITLAPPDDHRITPDKARAAYAILVAHAGAYSDARAADSFVYAVAQAVDPCREYRFCGSLGFGGKFRNNGNRGGVPYVDCYREHETPERLEMIETVNAKLAELFGNA